MGDDALNGSPHYIIETDQGSTKAGIEQVSKTVYRQPLFEYTERRNLDDCVELRFKLSERKKKRD